MPTHFCISLLKALSTGLITILFATFVSRSCPPLSAAELDKPAGSLIVRFVGGPVADNFGAVIAGLGSKDLLPHKAVYMTQPSPSDQFFLGGPVPGGGTSEAFEKYLCALNPHVCIDKNGRQFWTARISHRVGIDEKVCGFKSNTALDPDELCIPDIKLLSYVTVIMIHFDPTIVNTKGKSDVLGDKVLQQQACQKFDSDCIELLSTLNPWIKIKALRDGDFIGDLRLPALGFQFIVHPANSAQQALIEATIDDIRKDRQTHHQWDDQNPNVYFVVPGISFNPLGSGAPEDGPATPEPPFDASTRRYLKAMNYLWLEPGDRRLFDSFKPAGVLVLDTRIDEKHCYFFKPDASSVIKRYDHDQIYAPVDSVEPPTCGLVRDPDPNIDNDHGTFVTGMVDGGNDKVIRLNPKADLWVYAKSQPDDNPIRDAWANKDISRRFKAEVVNISDNLVEDPYGPVGAMITQPEDKDTLFIAAAGNDSLEFDQGVRVGCPAFPACLTSDYGDKVRVISVIGLDKDGRDLMECPNSRKTNYGTGFDVAAVGFGFSSLRGNAFGPMCGTSMAAPYVSGLASLINSKAQASDLWPLPEFVKERILSTADITEKLKGKVRFGRINFANALAYDKDLLRTATVNCTAESACAVSVIRRAATNLRVVRAYENGQDIRSETLPLDQILRIFRTGSASGQSLFRIIYRDPVIGLRILDNAAFAADAMLHIKKKGKSDVIKGDDIADFVPCSGTILHAQKIVADGECS